MRTLLFTIEYPPFKGGVANYYGNMVENWPLKSPPYEESTRQREGGIFVLHNNDKKLIKWWMRPKWLFAFRQLKKSIKKNKIDHVLVGHLLPLGTVAYFVCRRMKIPYSVFIHGMDITFAMRERRKRKMALKILQNAENIICASEYTGKIVSQFFESKVKSEKFIKLKEKIHVVHPGINSLVTHNLELITQLKNKYNLKDKIILFSVGRLVKRKGVDKVIEAMPEVLKSVQNIYYVIAGTGEDEKYLKDLASSLNSPPATTVTSPPKGANLNDHIIFLGKISDEEKWAWMEKCDIFIQPSRKIGDDFEGFGIVYLEAGICGKPVIAGDSGGIRDAVLGGTTGILVDPEKTDRIANAIISLATDKELRNKMGNAGKERAEKDFNWKGQAEKVYNLLVSSI